jgi:putative transposase
MARLARIIVPGMPHHVTQRGNRRQDVFFTPDDRCVYLTYLNKYLTRCGLDIYAYCLMTNHVHFIAVPTTELSLSHTMRDTHTAYAGYRNYTDETCGHLWQGRFFSSVLDETHLWAAIRYVERNPIRAGIVENAADYPWSSAAAHCNGTPDPILSSNFPPPGAIDDWTGWLSTDSDTDIWYIRQQTHTGRPCGSLSFFDQLETLLQRDVKPQKRGRKSKLKEDNNEET